MPHTAAPLPIAPYEMSLTMDNGLSNALFRQESAFVERRHKLTRRGIFARKTSFQLQRGGLFGGLREAASGTALFVMSCRSLSLPLSLLNNLWS